MGQETPLDLPLLRRRRHSQRIEVVGIFEDLLRQIGLWRGKLSVEVGQCLSVPLVKLAGDHVG